MIKLIAVVTMIIDHVGVVFFPQYTIFRIIGRIAMPLFAYCIARGFFYTGNKVKYFVLMSVFAVLSQVPFHYMRLASRGIGLTVDQIPYEVMASFQLDARYNIMVTWLLAMIFLLGLERFISWKSEGLLITSALLMAPILASFYLAFDFGLYGIILPALFYVTFYGRTVASGGSKKNVDIKVMDYVSVFAFVAITTYVMWVGRSSTQFYAVLAIPLIPLTMSFDHKVKLPKLFFYFAYPVHIIVLVAIAWIVRG